MRINDWDDDFFDYYYDAFDAPEPQEDDGQEELVKQVSFSDFSKMSENEKMNCLYYKISNLYSMLLSIQDVMKKGG